MDSPANPVIAGLASGWFFYRWLVVAPFLGLSTLLFGTLIVLMSLAGFPDLASRWFGPLWARANMFVSGMRVTIEGAEHLDPRRSYVLVANHQSLVDIYVLYGCLGVDVKWVMKKELRSVPIIGIACQLMGHVFVDRGNTEAAVASIRAAKARIKPGISVIFFPEGTRTDGNSLLPFKSGAFRFAQETGLPVLPVVLHDTCKVLPPGTTRIVPGRVRLELLAPIETVGLTADDVHGLVADVRGLIEQRLAA